MFFKSKKANKRQIQTIDLPVNLQGKSGIFAAPVKVLLEDDSFSDTVLCIQDNPQNIVDLSKLENLYMSVKSGAINTTYGVIGFLLFVIWDVKKENDKFTYEVLVNPSDFSSYKEYLSLDKQKSWDILIVQGNTVLNTFDFRNIYDIGESIEKTIGASENFPCIDFNAAKQEYFNLYTIEELLEI